MPFDDGKCIMYPMKAAMFYQSAPGVWTEWDGVIALSPGDIEIGAVELKNHNTDARAFVSPVGKLYVADLPDPIIVRVTGAAAVASTVGPVGTAWQLLEFRIHLSAVGTAGNLTITMDAGAGAAYDLVLFTQGMTAITDLIWQPTKPLVFSATDELDIAWANASTRTYGIEIFYTPIIPYT